MSISISSRREIHGMGRRFTRQSHWPRYGALFFLTNDVRLPSSSKLQVLILNNLRIFKNIFWHHSGYKEQKMNFQLFIDKAIAGQVLSREECQAILHCPDQHILALLDAAYQVRYHFCGKSVHLHMLINAKSGLCPEDCHYCSQ